jgi:hypothetical protein
MNKFDKFYSKKKTDELIAQVRQHRITGNTLEKVWFEALLEHLKNRNLSNEERNLFNHVTIVSPEALVMEGERFDEKIKSIKENAKPGEINFERIAEAGKSLKRIVFVVIISMVLAVICLMVISASSHENIQAYTFLSVIGIVSNLIVLVLLWLAGDSLANNNK